MRLKTLDSKAREGGGCVGWGEVGWGGGVDKREDALISASNMKRDGST